MVRNYFGASGAEKVYRGKKTISLMHVSTTSLLQAAAAAQVAGQETVDLTAHLNKLGARVTITSKR